MTMNQVVFNLEFRICVVCSVLMKELKLHCFMLIKKKKFWTAVLL